MAEQVLKQDPGDRLRSSIQKQFGTDRSPVTKAQVGNVLIALTAMQEQLLALSAFVVEVRKGAISEDTATAFATAANKATDAVGTAINAMFENEQ